MPRTLAIEADEAERAALARRFGLVAIDRLTAEAALTRQGDTVIAAGESERAGHPALRRQRRAGRGPRRRRRSTSIFRPAARSGRPEEEIELSEGELDVVFYDGAAIDLGEAVAETLSLSLDPYPRAPDAERRSRPPG